MQEQKKKKRSFTRFLKFGSSKNSRSTIHQLSPNPDFDHYQPVSITRFSNVPINESHFDEKSVAQRNKEEIEKINAEPSKPIEVKKSSNARELDIQKIIKEIGSIRSDSDKLLQDLTNGRLRNKVIERQLVSIGIGKRFADDLMLAFEYFKNLEAQIRRFHKESCDLKKTANSLEDELLRLSLENKDLKESLASSARKSRELQAENEELKKRLTTIKVTRSIEVGPGVMNLHSSIQDLREENGVLISRVVQMKNQEEELKLALLETKEKNSQLQKMVEKLVAKRPIPTENQKDEGNQSNKLIGVLTQKSILPVFLGFFDFKEAVGLGLVCSTLSKSLKPKMYLVAGFLKIQKQLILTLKEKSSFLEDLLIRKGPDNSLRMNALLEKHQPKNKLSETGERLTELLEKNLSFPSKPKTGEKALQPQEKSKVEEKQGISEVFSKKKVFKGFFNSVASALSNSMLSSNSIAFPLAGEEAEGEENPSQQASLDEFLQNASKLIRFLVHNELYSPFDKPVRWEDFLMKWNAVQNHEGAFGLEGLESKDTLRELLKVLFYELCGVGEMAELIKLLAAECQKCRALAFNKEDELNEAKEKTEKLLAAEAFRRKKEEGLLSEINRLKKEKEELDFRFKKLQKELPKLKKEDVTEEMEELKTKLKFLVKEVNLGIWRF